MAKVNRLTATFHYNGFCLNLDGKPMSCKEVQESDYIHSFDDRIMILLAFDKAVKEHRGITYKDNYESTLIYFLDLIKDHCKKPKNNKWLYEIIVQEWTCNGWADSCSELSMKAAIITKKEYQKEGIAARIINRRTANPDYVAK